MKCFSTGMVRNRKDHFNILEPYGWMLTNKEVFEHVVGGGKLPPPNEMPTRLVQVMQQCMDFDPELRPNFKEVDFVYTNNYNRLLRY